jgi:hypothetical protein
MLRIGEVSTFHQAKGQSRINSQKLLGQLSLANAQPCMRKKWIFDWFQLGVSCSDFRVPAFLPLLMYFSLSGIRLLMCFFLSRNIPTGVFSYLDVRSTNVFSLSRSTPANVFFPVWKYPLLVYFSYLEVPLLMHFSYLQVLPTNVFFLSRSTPTNIFLPTSKRPLLMCFSVPKYPC